MKNIFPITLNGYDIPAIAGGGSFGRAGLPPTVPALLSAPFPAYDDGPGTQSGPGHVESTLPTKSRMAFANASGASIAA